MGKEGLSQRRARREGSELSMLGMGCPQLSPLSRPVPAPAYACPTISATCSEVGTGTHSVVLLLPFRRSSGLFVRRRRAWRRWPLWGRWGAGASRLPRGPPSGPAGGAAGGGGGAGCGAAGAEAPPPPPRPRPPWRRGAPKPRRQS